MSSDNSWVLTHLTSFSKTCEIKPCKNVKIYSPSVKPVFITNSVWKCVSVFRIYTPRHWQNPPRCAMLLMNDLRALVPLLHGLAYPFPVLQELGLLP